MSEESKRRSLGRGLSALFGDEVADAPELRRSIRTVPIEQIRPGRYQPRRRFDADALEELAQSIRDKGILQPLLVRALPEAPNTFELIAGERRWRAAQQVPLHEVPVIVREFSDRETLEIALIENLQRADLDPLEEATAYQRLMEEFGHTQAELAQSVGKSRSHIANMIRLISLPQPVREMIAEGKLSSGHARALIGLEDAAALAKKASDEGLTVRQVEALAQQRRHSGTAACERGSPVRSRDTNTIALERELSEKLGATVSVRELPRGAVDLTVHCKTLDQLDAILRRLR